VRRGVTLMYVTVIISVLSFSKVTKSRSKTRFSKTSVYDDCFIKLV